MVGYRYDLLTRLARHAVIVLWAVATTGATFGPQQQPQTPGAPATASITGRLLDATSGQPIVGGVVVLREVASRD